MECCFTICAPIARKVIVSFWHRGAKTLPNRKQFILRTKDSLCLHAITPFVDAD